MFGSILKQLDDKWPSGRLRTVLLVVSGVTLSVLVALCIEPMLHVVEIGSDEHYELTKGLLWSRGFSLYGQVWSDQPPLLTVLLGLCFRTFGESIVVARALAGFFGVSLLAAFWAITIRRCGLLVSVAAVAFLLASPQVLSLSVSVMLEVPAIGTALWALWGILEWQEHRQSRWLVFSGVAFAIALEIKLTAIVLAPAIAGEILLGIPRSTWREGMWMLGRGVITWGGSVVLAFAALVVAFGMTPLEILQQSHFSASVTTEGATISGITGYWPILASYHGEVIWTTGIGIALVLAKNDSRRLAFCLITLAMVTVLYRYQHPFWVYYYLHVALPLSWLSAYAIGELLQQASALPVWKWQSWRVYMLTGVLLTLVEESMPSESLRRGGRSHRCPEYSRVVW